MPFDQKERWAKLALAGIRREYPNKISYHLNSRNELLPPSEQTPIFYGCFDWHSAVHAHWTLTRLLQDDPSASFKEDVRQLFREQFSQPSVAKELLWLQKNPSFERPYGLAWLILLIKTLQNSPDESFQDHAKRLLPLQVVATQNLLAGLKTLPYPIRTGTHQQTAFSIGLVWEVAKQNEDDCLIEQLSALAKRFFAKCRAGCLAAEPSGHDFLSPFLAEADLMSQILPRQEFARWWSLPTDLFNVCQPVEVVDQDDGHLVHFAGLNLSRAWMLSRIAHCLRDVTFSRSEQLNALAFDHRKKGLNQIKDDAYAGSHWLGTFAVYMMHRAEGQN